MFQNPAPVNEGKMAIMNKQQAGVGMKIALLDLNHFSRGVHTNTVPLGLGLIATYLKEHIKHPFDIRLFKDAKKYLSTIKTWMPDVVGLAQYSWNSELNIHLAKLTKQLNPECLVIAGGPNLEFDRSKKFLFLKQNSLNISYRILFASSNFISG